tara:strand:- start:2376 stop:3338 length:963 start_codon:yes stop_codon:yes gene_type:complete
MPSKSKKQQRFMGMLYHCKETGDCPDKDIKEKAKKIKKKDVQDFAGTKHKGLPEKVRKKKRKKKKKSKRSYITTERLISLANELDVMGFKKEADEVDKILERTLSEDNEAKCIPIDEWEGPPEGMEIHSHSTSGGIDLFNNVLSNGFRVASSGHGDLGITFLQEDSLGIIDSLRYRTSEDNKQYNLGPTVILAAIDPSLTVDTGISDRIIEEAREFGIGFLQPKPIKNVRVFEQWDDDHKWSDNAYKMPGRFIYAMYNGDDDTICINPNWDGSSSTDYGQRLVENNKEYRNLKRFNPDSDKSEDVPEGVQVSSDSDYDVW